MGQQVQRSAFDPVLVGRSECEGWIGYCRRDWLRMLAGLIGMLRHGFALGPFRHLKSAWGVLRGSQGCASFHDNDPGAARRHLTRLFRLARKASRVCLDPRLSADIVVAWWQTFRALQHDAQVSD